MEDFWWVNSKIEFVNWILQASFYFLDQQLWKYSETNMTLKNSRGEWIHGNSFWILPNENGEGYVWNLENNSLVLSLMAGKSAILEFLFIVHFFSLVHHFGQQIVLDPFIGFFALFEVFLKLDMNFVVAILKVHITKWQNRRCEKKTCYQMAHQLSVILMDHLVTNKLVHAVLNMVIVEVLQLIVNVPTVLIIEKVRLSKISYVPRKVKSMNLFLIHLLQLHHKSLMA